jgi:hypothetical protein
MRYTVCFHPPVCVRVALENVTLKLFLAGDYNVTDSSSNNENRHYYKPEFELVARQYLSFEDLSERAAFVYRRKELASMLMAVRLYTTRRANL